jgi:hypothetical protein
MQNYGEIEGMDPLLTRVSTEEQVRRRGNVPRAEVGDLTLPSHVTPKNITFFFTAQPLATTPNLKCVVNPKRTFWSRPQEGGFFFAGAIPS